MPTSPNSLMDSNTLGDFVPQSYPGRDIFSFGIDANLDFTDLDFGWITSQNTKIPMWNLGVATGNESPVEKGHQNPNISNGITAGAEAFERSLWRWAPQSKEHAYAEQANLSLPYKDMQTLEARHAPGMHSFHLDQNSRDQILAMLLNSCKPGNGSRMVTSFPSAPLLDSLMHIFFQSELLRTDSWIHVPTFRPENQRAEFNGIVVAAGAILSKIPAVRKLGFAIQEAVRIAIPHIVRFIPHIRLRLTCSEVRDG